MGSEKEDIFSHLYTLKESVGVHGVWVTHSGYTVVCYYINISLLSLMLLIINIPCILYSLQALWVMSAQKDSVLTGCHSEPLWETDTSACTVQVFTEFTNRRQLHRNTHPSRAFCRCQISPEPPEVHRAHNGLFLVLIINIGGEGKEEENVAPVRKAITIFPIYSHLWDILFAKK